jgi:hypothetical protein
VLASSPTKARAVRISEAISCSSRSSGWRPIEHSSLATGPKHPKCNTDGFGYRPSVNEVALGAPKDRRTAASSVSDATSARRLFRQSPNSKRVTTLVSPFLTRSFV